MELKKSPKADLEQFKRTFLLTGFVISLLCVLLAFEWGGPVSSGIVLDGNSGYQVPEEIIPPNIDYNKKPPPPPSPVVIELLKITNNYDDSFLDLGMFVSEPGEIIYDLPVYIKPPEKEKDDDVAGYFTNVEIMPEFPGGDQSLLRYLSTAVKYPQIAIENNIQGKVYVSFIIDTDGSVTNAVIARGVDPSLDREAIRVVSSMPRWKPGRQSNKYVRVAYTVPINFVLQ